MAGHHDRRARPDDPRGASHPEETLRSSNPLVPVRWLRATANPGGPSHAYVRSHFVDATDDGRKVITDDQGRTTRFIRSSVFDNEKHVGRKYIAILEGIEDPARRKSMLEGDFNAFFGQVFQEFDPTRHIVPRKDVHIPAGGADKQASTTASPPRGPSCGPPWTTTGACGPTVSFTSGDCRLRARPGAS